MLSRHLDNLLISHSTDIYELIEGLVHAFTHRAAIVLVKRIAINLELFPIMLLEHPNNQSGHWMLTIICREVTDSKLCRLTRSVHKRRHCKIRHKKSGVGKRQLARKYGVIRSIQKDDRTAGQASSTSLLFYARPDLPVLTPVTKHRLAVSQISMNKCLCRIEFQDLLEHLHRLRIPIQPH